VIETLQRYKPLFMRVSTAFQNATENMRNATALQAFIHAGFIYFSKRTKRHSGPRVRE